MSLLDGKPQQQAPFMEMLCEPEDMPADESKLTKQEFMEWAHINSPADPAWPTNERNHYYKELYKLAREKSEYN